MSHVMTAIYLRDNDKPDHDIRMFPYPHAVLHTDESMDMALFIPLNDLTLLRRLIGELMQIEDKAIEEGVK